MLFIQFVLLLAIMASLVQAFLPMTRAQRAFLGSSLQMKQDPYSHVLRNPIVNKGTSFSKKERDSLDLHGLIPGGEPLSLETKVEIAIEQLRKKSSPIDKYIFLHTIQDSDETLFYAVLTSHLRETMPLVYTPTVGQACQEWSHIYRHTPRGVYVTLNDLGRVKNILHKHPNKNVKVIVVTDGERILGLGDLGANGMGIPVGKMALYTACAGIRPEQCLPVVLDVGTNTESIRKDKAYMGLRCARDRSERYDQLVEEFFNAAQEVYGKDVLIQFEDFGNSNAFRLLDKYKTRATCFNDDIQGTASVVLAGLISSLPLAEKKKLSDHVYLFQGAGEAGIGIADLIAAAIVKESGVSLEEAKKHCWFVDSKGLITSDRLKDPKLEHHKIPYAHDKSLLKGKADLLGTGLWGAVNAVQPSAIIGVSAQGGAFTEEIVKYVASINKKPVIFALSNPTHKAECTAQQAYSWTNGKAVFASGSPFDPVTLPDGQHFVPGQGNNAYIFPGVGLAAVLAEAVEITDEDFLVAAQTLASIVSKDRLDVGCAYPPVDDIRQVSKHIAVAVAKNIYETGRSKLSGELKEVNDTYWLRRASEIMYKPEYVEHEF